MRILLGIDVGKAKTGIARSAGPVAEPLTVLKDKNIGRLAGKIAQVAKKEEVETVVIGLPSGPIAQIALKLGNLIAEKNIEVKFWDETLTTKDAQKMAIEAGIKRKKRKSLEDAFAAALMLQSYLDDRMTR